MGFKHKALDQEAVRATLVKPNFLLKIIPHVDGSPRICELVDYRLEDIVMKGAWTGPATLDLRSRPLPSSRCARLSRRRTSWPTSRWDLVRSSTIISKSKECCP
jgi:acetoacetate decarboxylase